MAEIQNSTEYYWIHSVTLGGKQKQFSWRIDEQFNLYIKRERNEKQEKITVDSLDKIYNFVKENERTALANNVAKLSKDEEKEGLGKFIFENIKEDTTYAQLSSQIGAIFVEVNIWTYNGEKKGIKFKSFINDWRDKLIAYYSRKEWTNNFKKLHSDFTAFKENLDKEIKETKDSINNVKSKVNKIEEKLEDLKSINSKLDDIKKENKELANKYKSNNENMLKDNNKIQNIVKQTQEKLNDLNSINSKLDEIKKENKELVDKHEIQNEKIQNAVNDILETIKNTSKKNQEDIEKLKKIG